MCILNTSALVKIIWLIRRVMFHSHATEAFVFQIPTHSLRLITFRKLCLYLLSKKHTIVLRKASTIRMCFHSPLWSMSVAISCCSYRLDFCIIDIVSRGVLYCSNIEVHSESKDHGFSESLGSTFDFQKTLMASGRHSLLGEKSKSRVSVPSIKHAK